MGEVDDWTAQIKAIDSADFAVSGNSSRELDKGIKDLVNAFNAFKTKVASLGGYESPGQEALAQQVMTILKNDATVHSGERLDKYRDYLLELSSAMNLSVKDFVEADKNGS